MAVLTHINSHPATLPDDYLAVPIDAGQLNASLQLCAVLSVNPDPATGHLVLLREGFDARVYLACICDRAGRVDRWLELSVQNLDNLGHAPHAVRESASNASLDRRWVRISTALQQMPMSRSICTGFESVHPLPALLDMKQKKPVHPIESESGQPWELCLDEAVLAKRGVPNFGASVHRYLYIRSLGEKSPLVAATTGAPVNQDMLPLSTILAKYEDLVPLNPVAGLLRVREFNPIDIPAFLNLLAGRELGGMGLPAGAFTNPGNDPSPSANGEWNRNAWLLIGQHGKRGRLLENFHLKLRIVADAVESVKRFVVAAHQPILTLNENSFQVWIAGSGAGLPALWTARVELIDPGDTVDVTLPTTDVRRYLPASTRGASIYNPAAGAAVVAGRGDLCVRKITPETAGAVLIEGTFSTQERLGSIGGNDLARFRLSSPLAGLELFARLETGAGLAPGEWRFRSVPQRFDEPTGKRIRAAAGVLLRGIEFEILPMLSTPCDLHSLACLAVRTLLVNDKRSLPEAIDEMSSLTRALARPGSESGTLPERIARVFNEDPRWRAALGPQWIVDEGLSAAEAMDLVPAELWWATLAIILRMFPGGGPDSICRDLGDALPHALQRVFDPVLEEIERLLVKSRSLILIDWRYNREIHAVIRGCMMGLGPLGAKS